MGITRSRKYQELETRKKNATEKPHNKTAKPGEVSYGRLAQHFYRKEDKLEPSRFLPSCAMSLTFSFWTRCSIRPLDVTGSPNVTQNICENTEKETWVLY